MEIGKFVPPIFHPNVYPSGAICSSLLNEEGEGGWFPSFSHTHILLTLQQMLHYPNPNASAPNIEAHNLFKNNKREYKLRILAEAKKYSIYK